MATITTTKNAHQATSSAHGSPFSFLNIRGALLGDIVAIIHIHLGDVLVLPEPSQQGLALSGSVSERNGFGFERGVRWDAGPKRPMYLLLVQSFKSEHKAKRVRVQN